MYVPFPSVFPYGPFFQVLNKKQVPCFLFSTLVLKIVNNGFVTMLQMSVWPPLSMLIKSIGIVCLPFRTVELLLSVNGETSNTNGLKATKATTPGSTVALSLSATVYLERWQTLYLMIRSTGDGALEVLNGSTFSVALVGI